MAKTGIEQVNTTDTFQGWLNKTNELVALVNADVMTASAIGDTTIGNATLVGTFTANTANVTDTVSANTASVLTIRNRGTITNNINAISPITISSVNENMLTLTSPAEYKPQLRLINGSNIRWMLSHNNSSTTSSFVIQTEGSVPAQVTVTQAGRVIANEFQGDGSNLTNINATSIPDIDASKITTGVLALARIPNLDAAKIPNLDASKITTGVFADARLPTNIVRNTRTIITYSGITGGGDLSANRTIGLTGQALSLHNVSGTGFISRGSDGTIRTRIISGDGVSISVSNGDGNSSFPVISAIIATQAEAVAGTNTTKLMTPQRTVQAIMAYGIPGQVAHFAMTTPPTGWLKANGAAVPRTTYAALFAAIGTTFGAGNGSTTFNLPDLRGEFIRGWSDGRTVDTSRVFGSLQLDAFQGHRHRFTDSGGANLEIMPTTNTGSGSSSRAVVAGAGNVTVRNAVANTVHGEPREDQETRPRNVALLACIKF